MLYECVALDREYWIEKIGSMDREDWFDVRHRRLIYHGNNCAETGRLPPVLHRLPKTG